MEATTSGGSGARSTRSAGGVEASGAADGSAAGGAGSAGSAGGAVASGAADGSAAGGAEDNVTEGTVGGAEGCGVGAFSAGGAARCGCVIGGGTQAFVMGGTANCGRGARRAASTSDAVACGTGGTAGCCGDKAGHAGMAHPWLPEGMDPDSSYLLEMKLLGNPKKKRKEFSCFAIDKVVDADTTNFKDLIEWLVEKYPPGYEEIVHVHYYDNNMKNFTRVTTDQDLVSMFHRHRDSKVVHMTIACTEPSETYDPLAQQHIDGTEPLQNPPIIESEQDNYLENPSPENEHVGVDEECIYLGSKPVQSRVKDMDKDYVPDSDSSSDSDVEAEEVEQDNVPCVTYDVEDPSMIVDSEYPNMEVFKLAIAQHAVKHEFEYHTEKSDPRRFRAYCARRDDDACPWRIHASSKKGMKTVKVKKNPFPHKCSSTRRNKKVKNASKHWVCAKVKDWLLDDATLGAKVLQRKIKEHYKVTVHYKRVYMGKELALQQLYGDWDNSFDNLYRFKAEVERSCPGSLVIIDHHTVDGKIRFNRLFFALKPCIEGFLSGCRPYLAIDSTFLTGKFKGQLATACAVDGHNWMFPVAFGVFASETNDNWIWYMKMLRESIGSPSGLAISTDAGQAIMTGVSEVFPEVEHRECMFHLVSNFKKKFRGKVFDDHLWPAAYSWHPHFFEKHWAAMEEENPAATNYLRKGHTKLWTRSQFSTRCKVDYVTNNLVESFNNWIKHYKSMNLDDLIDKIRQMLMIKWNQRRKVARKLEGLVLPHIMKKLVERTRGLDLDVMECSDEVAEVSTLGGSGFRCVVNLGERTCSCRKWQVCGIPCVHAIAFITSLHKAPLESFVDSFYSVQKFRDAYEQIIPAIPDKAQWPKACHGFFMHPPLLTSTAGRRKTERFKGCNETTGGTTKKGQHKCPICKDYGHHWHKCKKGDPADIAAMMAIRGPPKKKRRTTKAGTESSIVPFDDEAPAACMNFPPSQSTEVSSKKKGKGDTSSKKKGKGDTSGSGKSKCASNQLEAISIEYPMVSSMSITEEQEAGPAVETTKKRKKVVARTKTMKKKDAAKDNPKGTANKLRELQGFDSPAMSTRSKKFVSASPSMSTRSKRRLSL